MSHESREIRRHLLDTAESLILGKGFHKVGLTEILAAAGVPKGSFYYYFPSKEQFGQAILDHHFERYLKRMETLLAPDGRSARERILEFWGLWQETQDRGPCQEQCMVVKLGAEVSDLSEPMRAALLKGTGQILARLTACLRSGVEEGSLAPSVEPESTAQALYELWLGASLLTKVRREPSALGTARSFTRALLPAPDASLLPVPPHPEVLP